MTTDYDALLFVSFGGPEGPDDVIPFLENVLRGRNVPRQRMLAVAEHYYQFGGVSPINQQNRDLITALGKELAEKGPQLPIYWGNRNWHPMLADTLSKMRDDDVRRALAFVTSAFSSYSGCRQYREDIIRAQQEVGDGAPQVDKLRVYFNHPNFIAATSDRVTEALAEIPRDRRASTHLLFTAHSIPIAMANGCDYVLQLNEAASLVAESVQAASWSLVYQSRSGPPTQPWLEPDVCDFLTETSKQRSCSDVVIVPIGFISDHMEVVYDLDTEARDVCCKLKLNMVRAKTVGTHPAFVSMIRELILERTEGAKRRALGELGPRADDCPTDCCLRS